MTFNKYLMWARSGIKRNVESMDAKYKKKAKKRLFSGKRNRPCTYCSKPLSYKRATLDHMTARSKGGKNIGNLALACRSCNERKGSMTVDQFRALLASEALDEPR